MPKPIPKIEEINSAETWEVAKPLVLEALREITRSLPQGDYIVTEGSPENEIKADAGKALALDQKNGKLYFKETGVANKTGWREVSLV